MYSSFLKTGFAFLFIMIAGTSYLTAKTLPIDAFAMRPGMQQVSISPDGKKMGLLRAQSKNGDYILEIYNTDNLKQKPVVLGAAKMEITGFRWLNDERVWVDFRQKKKRGKSKWRSLSMITDADGKGKWDKLPSNGADILYMLPKEPDEVLLQYDVNDNRIDDIVKYNVNTGRKKTIFRGNTKRPQGFIVDEDGEVRGAIGFDAGKFALEHYVRRKGSKDWILLFENRAAERVTFDILGFNPDNTDEVFVLANNGEDKASIWVMDIVSKTFKEKIFGLKNVDVFGIIRSGKKKNAGQLIGFSYATSKSKRIYIDGEEKALYDAIQNLFPEHNSRIISRSADDNNMIVFVNGPREAGSYYLLKDKSKLQFIGSRFPLIKPEHLSNVKFIRYPARDDLKIPAYVTIPKGKAPFPTIVMPHGGPWSRDVPGYDEWSQLLAHHGYLVIQPQFRGSEGFGLHLWKAGDKKWGLEMQDDLDDAMHYLVKKGLADQNRLAMFGWSYGGYAAFVGSMRDNNIYKCTVAGAGVSDLSRISAQIFESYFSRKVQRPTVKGISPLEQVEKVNVPIFVIHGDIDQRVPIVHSREFAKKLKELGKDYKYTELKGADHFSNTLFYDHKKQFYSELLDWLGNKCFK